MCVSERIPIRAECDTPHTGTGVGPTGYGGFTQTDLVELMGERGVVDAGAAGPTDVPVKAVVHVITCHDPRQYTGQILRAAAFVKENEL